jgi:hypothetical protein
MAAPARGAAEARPGEDKAAIVGEPGFSFSPFSFLSNEVVVRCLCVCVGVVITGIGVCVQVLYVCVCVCVCVRAVRPVDLIQVAPNLS